jgi:thymidylate kinase
MAAFEEQNRAYGRAVPQDMVEGLYPSFHTAATILRIARSLGELDESVATEVSAVDAFFERLCAIESCLLSNKQPGLKTIPYIIVVEGLDGSGKSTLVQCLAAELQGRAVATPTDSLASVRPVFDKRGAAVARAFYMVGNYVLQHEILEEASTTDSELVFVVDRWYTSTCAYSIAWKNTAGGPESVDRIAESLFEWPRDLRRPDLLLLLLVDDDVRKERVRARAQTSDYSHWDGRLDRDADLGKRILRALERVAERQEHVVLNASQTQEQVLTDALTAVNDRLGRQFRPWEFFRKQPLEFFCWVSAKLGLCDFRTGRRLKQRPWAIQLALNVPGGAPSLRTVGVHTVNETGILFFTRGHRGDGQGGDRQRLASMTWVGGDYPFEQHWRAEGFLCEMTSSECDFLLIQPSTSLVAQILACEQQEKKMAGLSRQDRGEEHNDLACQLRSDHALLAEKGRRDVQGTRFVPMRMEVLMEGPSSPGGPRRFEWTRRYGEPDDEHSNGWSQAREILPFSPPSAVSSTTLLRTTLAPLTLAITGTHCAGKATLCKKLASVLGWSFQPELGEILRGKIASGDHRLGYDSPENDDATSWDDLIYQEEVNRDASSSSRVVETWHIGNLAWACMRKEVDRCKSPLHDGHDHLTDRTRLAIQQQLARSSILFVHLSVSAETSVRRRGDDASVKRLPMENEQTECEELYSFLEKRGVELLGELSDPRIPVLTLDNSRDGDVPIDEATRLIVDFVNRNQWRRGLSS